MEKLKILFLSCLLAVSPSLFAQMSLKDSSKAYLYKHGGNYMAKSWQDAADVALKIDSTNSNIWQLKGMPYLKAGDYENAFRYDDKAVKLNPEEFLTYRAFCKAIFLKDYDSALLDFEVADANPKIPKYVMDHSIQFYEGLCYFGKKDYAKAKLLFEESIKEQNKRMGENEAHYLDYFYLGLCFMRTNDIENATKTLEMCRSKFNHFPDVLYYLALISSQNKQPKTALDYIQQAETNFKAKLRLNEDNEVYANYPAQIQIYEINQLLKKLTK